MAIDKKISQLTNGAPAQAADEYVVARGAANYKLTLTNIAATMPPIGATTPNTGAFTTLSSSAGANFATSSGSVGVGRSPSTKLDVEGQVRGLTRYYLQRPSDNYSLSIASRWDGSTGSPLTGTAGVNMVFGNEEATGNVIFATENVQRARIAANGQFLIGTTSTVSEEVLSAAGSSAGWRIGSNRTAVLGSGNAAGGFNYSGGNASSATAGVIYARAEAEVSSATASSESGALVLLTRNSGTLAERARITAAGNLAIGTTTAATKVQIFNGSYGSPATSGTTQANGALRLSASGTTGVLDFGIGASGTNQWIQATDSGGLGIAYNLLLNPNGGNVGIGTTSPSARLHVKGDWVSNEGILAIDANSGQQFSGLTIQNNGAFKGFLYHDNTNSFVEIQCADELRLNVTGSQAIKFQTGASERARITSGGDFCVGVTSGYTVGGIPGSHSIVKNGSGYWACGVQNSASSSPYGLNIYYGNVTPNGTGNEFLYCHDSTAPRASIRSNGGISNYQANDVNLSDKRVKTDIKPVGSYWDKIKAIEIVTFKYKDQTHDDDNVGVIAQQVESVAPEFVDVDGFGDTPEDGVPLKTIYTTDMYHAAIKALQEAMARIEKLESEVAALKGA